MASILDGIDTTNPCLVWPVLEKAYYAMLAGETEYRARFGDREVEFQRTNLTSLQAEIVRLKAECGAVTPGARRRYAIRGGFRAR